MEFNNYKAHHGQLQTLCSTAMQWRSYILDYTGLCPGNSKLCPGDSELLSPTSVEGVAWISLSLYKPLCNQFVVYSATYESK